MTILYYNVHIGCTCGCRDVPSKHFVLFMFVGEIRGLCLLHFFLQLLPLQLLQLQHVHMLLRSNRRGWICKSPQLDPLWDRKGFQWISSDSHRCYDAAGLLNIETNLPTVLETIQQPALPQPAWAFLPALAIAPFLAAVRPAVPATVWHKHGTNKPCMSLSKQDQIGMCGMSIWPQKKHHRCHRHLGSHPVDKVWCFWCLCLLQLFFQLKLQRSGLHVPLFLSQTWADLSPRICDSILCSIWLWSLNCYKFIVLMSKPCNSTLQRWNHI